jgi:DNA repair protein RAD7
VFSNEKIGNEALSSILDHSARTLQMLDLNSVDELRAEALERLAKETIHLEWLDVSFVRDVDDFIIKLSTHFLLTTKRKRKIGVM